MTTQADEITVQDWHSPPVIPAAEKMHGAWRPVGEAWTVTLRVPTLFNGFGFPIETRDLPVKRRIERRPVWKFVGYEERTVES